MRRQTTSNYEPGWSYGAALMILVALCVFGCTTKSNWSRYEMCFGLSADSGRTFISEEQWKQFRDDEIIKHFPDGFTVLPANGYWRSGDETYAEPAMIFMVVAPESSDTERKLDEIAQAYARRFRQQSVLQIRSPAKVEFLSKEEQ